MPHHHSLRLISTRRDRRLACLSRNLRAHVAGLSIALDSPGTELSSEDIPWILKYLERMAMLSVELDQLLELKT
jgi:hypothetical protein